VPHPCFDETRPGVGAKQRGVSGDDLVADLLAERGMIRGTDDLRGVGWKHDVAAAIIPDDLWLDVGAGTVGRSVHMRAETDDGHPLVGIRRDRRVDVAMVVEMGVADSHRLQLVREQAAQVLLFFGGWAGRRSRVRWVSMTT
jgi:hypothetical protein